MQSLFLIKTPSNEQWIASLQWNTQEETEDQE